MGLVLKTLAKGTTSNESECVLGAFDVSAWYFPFENGMETERCRMSLKKRRAYALMTQEQLAEAAGISSRTVKKMEAKGVGSSPARNVAKVARCLGCTVEDLIGEEDEKKNNAPKVGSQAGAAIKSTDDSTTFADDARFAARALGAGELLAPLSELRDPRTLLALLGAWLVIVGMFLTLALIG